jgi:hypothetical protein
MKKTLRCPKCDHNRLLHIRNPFPVLVRSDVGMSSATPALAQTAPTRTPSVLPDWLNTAKPRVAGDVDAAMCRSCGYLELYCMNPESIPVDGEYVVELVGPTGYRDVGGAVDALPPPPPPPPPPAPKK